MRGHCLHKQRAVRVAREIASLDRAQHRPVIRRRALFRTAYTVPWTTHSAVYACGNDGHFNEPP